MRKKLVLWMTALMATVLMGCQTTAPQNTFEKNRAHALMGVADFRALIHAQDYVRLYEMLAPEHKSNITYEQFIEESRSTQMQLGAYRSANLVGSSCFGNEVRLVYRADFENLKATEWMVWSVRNNQVSLNRYQVIPGHAEFKKESQKNCALALDSSNKIFSKEATNMNHPVSTNNPCPFLRALVTQGALDDTVAPINQVASVIVDVARTGEDKPQLPAQAIKNIAMIANGLSPLQLFRTIKNGLRLNEL